MMETGLGENVLPFKPGHNYKSFAKQWRDALWSHPDRDFSKLSFGWLIYGFMGRDIGKDISYSHTFFSDQLNGSLRQIQRTKKWFEKEGFIRVVSVGNSKTRRTIIRAELPENNYSHTDYSNSDYSHTDYSQDPSTMDSQSTLHCSNNKKKIYKRKKSVKTLIPTDWQPSPETVAWVVNELGFSEKSVQSQIGRMIDHHHSKGMKYVNFDSTFKNWMRNQRKWAKQKKQQGFYKDDGVHRG